MKLQHCVKFKSHGRGLEGGIPVERQRKRKAKVKYMNKEAILEVEPPVPASTVDVMWIWN